MAYTIYALFDEREPDVVRYVGFSKLPGQRHEQHLGEARWSAALSHRLNWLRKVQADGGRVLWRELAVVETADEAATLEMVLIREHIEGGHPLTNGTQGGEGVQGFGGVLSAEAAARKVATMNTPEYREQRSQMSGRYWSSEDARKNQGESMSRYWSSADSQDTREKSRAIAKAQHLDPNYTGGPRTDEAREKMREAKLGKPHAKVRTAEWNAKISAAQKGKPRGAWSEERKAAHAARLNDPATKAKMSASAKARHQP